jgi:hypothetical protein
MYFKTEISCKLLPAKPDLSTSALCLARPPFWCTHMLYINICMHPCVANDCPRCHFANKLNRKKRDQSFSYLFFCRLGQGLDHGHLLHDIDLDGGRELHLYETIKSASISNAFCLNSSKIIFILFISSENLSP